MGLLELGPKFLLRFRSAGTIARVVIRIIRSIKSRRFAKSSGMPFHACGRHAVIEYSSPSV
jgi:hypothetical protein